MPLVADVQTQEFLALADVAAHVEGAVDVEEPEQVACVAALFPLVEPPVGDEPLAASAKCGIDHSFDPCCRAHVTTGRGTQTICARRAPQLAPAPVSTRGSAEGGLLSETERDPNQLSRAYPAKYASDAR